MLLGFKKRFAPKILGGSKKFTIREPRKVEPKLGERLYMYTGLRTKHCEKICDHHTLISICLVEIQLFQKSDGSGWMDIRLEGALLNAVQQEKFVRYDGFENEKSFADYWLSTKKPDKYGTRYLEIKDYALYAWEEFTL